MAKSIESTKKYYYYYLLCASAVTLVCYSGEILFSRDMSPPFDTRKFSQCLFAYLYKYYEEKDFWKNKPDMPKMNYEVYDCSSFMQLFGKTQIEVNRMLRPHLHRVFRMTYQKACVKEEFKDYAYRMCRQSICTDKSLSEMPSPIFFLAVCAVVSELNFCTFLHECYSTAQSAPIALEFVLNNLKKLKNFFEGKRPTPSAFKRLRRCCKGIMHDVKKEPGIVFGVFQDIGLNFAKLEFDRVARKKSPKGYMSPMSEKTEPSVFSFEEGSSVLGSPEGTEKPVGATAIMEEDATSDQGAASKPFEAWVDPLPIEKPAFDEDHEPYDFDQESVGGYEESDVELEDETESYSPVETRPLSPNKCKKCRSVGCIQLLGKFAVQFAEEQALSPEQATCFSKLCP